MFYLLYAAFIVETRTFAFGEINDRGFNSLMYNWLISGSTVTSESTLEAWKGDLNVEISTEE